MNVKQTDAINQSLMLSIQDVAELLKCSDRHIANMRNEGRMPPCIKLGTLVRWPRKTIEEWIVGGCPAPSPRPRRRDGKSAA
jgi:excisionase family DNA binding protein